jgi:Domain of unknown function (DUF4234)
MAEDLRFTGVQVKKRNPWGIFGLTLITIGIYGFVWWYKINTELRDYSAAAGAPLNNNPARSVLAFIPGFLILIPPFVTIWKTCERIEQVRATVDGRPAQSVASTGLLAMLLYFVAGIHGVLLGYSMNDLWEAARARAGEGNLPQLAGGTAPAIAQS